MFSFISAGEDYGARMVTLRCQETKTISVESLQWPVTLSCNLLVKFSKYLKDLC